MRYLLRRVFRNSRQAHFALIEGRHVFIHKFLLHLQERLPTMRLLIALCLLVSSVYAQAPGEIYLTPKIDLQLQPVAVAGLEDRTLNVPPGFIVELFAEDVGKARLMAWSPDSVLHVAVMGTRGSSEWRADPNRTGRVVALPDRDRDGRADEVRTVADDLLWPNSVAFYQGAMYVADTDGVVRFRDGDGDGFYEEREVFIPDLATWIPGLGGAEHVTHTIVFDEANGRVYVHQGASCDLCRESDPERATVLAFNLDGTGRRIFARGLRNSIGLALHPLTGELWATNNGHDRSGRDLPPETIVIVREGGFYGWPLAHGYQAWVDFEIDEYFRSIAPFTRQDTLDVERMEQPAATVGAHTAPMAIHFYTGDQFPSEYRNQAFVALRAGARGNDPGYKVVAVFSDPDGQNSQVGDFLTGFRPNPGRNRVWGKPVGLESDAQGALYVSSDHTTQAVFRVRVGPLMGQWEVEPPDTVLAGQPLDLSAAIALTRFDREAADPVVIANLSALGGSAETPLTALGDGRYRLEAALAGAENNGREKIAVSVAQNTAEGPFEIALSRTLVVLPAEDLAIADDELAAGWAANAGLGLDSFDFDGSGPVFTGTAAGVLTADPLTRLLPWQLDMEPPAPIETVGYRALRLALHPGDVVPAEDDVVEVVLESGGFQRVVLLGEGAGDYGLDLGRKEWQEIEVPLSAFGILDRPIETVRFAANIEGRFYIDDLRLVRTEFARPTIVHEAREDATPQHFGLEQNFPNPFNGQTAIRYTLDRAQEVELKVYTLTGQHVATLISGLRSAGRHMLHWDGRDGQGHPLASGLYLYQLRAGSERQTRKLLLVR